MGILRLTINEAVLQRDVNTFLTMNPHYEIAYNGEKTKGEPHYDGGKTPKWNALHQIDIGDDPAQRGSMIITVFEDDKEICSCEFGVQDLVTRKGADHWEKCFFEGKEAGSLSLHVYFDDRNDKKPAAKQEEHKQPQA